MDYDPSANPRSLAGEEEVDENEAVEARQNVEALDEVTAVFAHPGWLRVRNLIEMWRAAYNVKLLSAKDMDEVRDAQSMIQAYTNLLDVPKRVVAELDQARQKLEEE